MLGHEGPPSGQGSKTHVQQPIFEAQDEEREVDDIVQSLAAGRGANVLGTLCGGVLTPESQHREASTSAHRLDVMLPRLASSSLVSSATASPPAVSKRKRAVNGDSHSPKRRRGVEAMRSNVVTLKKMKRLKDKFDVLEACLENEIPLPSRLLAESDDEGEEYD